MARDRAARPEAKPLRLFVAADVPETVKDLLAERVSPFMDRIPGARWTKPPGWHVTLKFLGSTWPRLVEEVKAAIGTVAGTAERFESALTELGAFPSPRRARVLWAGLADHDRRFGEVVRSLDLALEEHFAAEKRAFTPHLTIARLAPPRDLGEFVPDLVGTKVASDRFPVDRLVLYRSHLSPRGATYEPLERYPLGSR